jgi:redox-sensitive bicupin YhaK (pirin superfamily)
MGHSAALKPGEVQRISAGSGIAHSEFNPSRNEPVHFLQIWLMPDAAGVQPSYDQRDFSPQLESGEFVLVASKAGGDGSIAINQDASIYAARLPQGATLNKTLDAGRHGWVQVARGGVLLNGVALEQGDGAAISDESRLEFSSPAGAELIFFDLA